MVNLAINITLNPDQPVPPSKIQIDGKGNYYIFTPLAEPMDHEDLRDIYSLQIFA